MLILLRRWIGQTLGKCLPNKLICVIDLPCSHPKDNRELEIKVATAKNLNIFFEQSSLTHEANDMWVEQTLTQLLTNNMKLLQQVCLMLSVFIRI